jgi:hypothetical protein
MQCENHEEFVQVALNYGWMLWEYGTDSTCEVGGDAPHHALIWLKPCAWDEDQKIPVGCVCCTDLNDELFKYAEEVFDIVESRRIERGKPTRLPEEYPRADRPPALAGRVDWLDPYRAK